MIRDGHPDYVVTAHSWPTFLYAGNKCNADDIEEGLFRNGMLVKVSLATSSDFIWCKHSQAFKYLFTSPTSANDDANDPPQPPAKRAKRNLGATRSHVASLIGMRSMTPRAIAYVAVQVCLNFLDQAYCSHPVDSSVSHSLMLTHGGLLMANLVTKCSMQPVLTILRTSLVLWLVLVWMPFSHGGTGSSSA
jgi:hypothetical protein